MLERFDNYMINSVPTNYRCLGFLDEYRDHLRNGNIVKGVVETVVYYNPEINSVIAFEVSGDFFCNLFESGKSIEEFTELLNQRDNVVYFNEVYSDDACNLVDYNYRSLKGKHICNIVDVLKEL